MINSICRSPGLALWLCAALLAGCDSETSERTRASDPAATDAARCEQPQAAGAEEMTEDTPFFAPKHIAPLKPLDPQLGNPFARQYTPLHGQWNFIVDQLATGDASPLLYGGVGRNQKAAPTELLEYSFAGGDTLAVPGDWNSQHQELFWYRGVIWYQKEFEFTPRPGRRTFLYFGGGNYRKDVYVNGQLLARHSGGFTPFNIEVTDFLQPGSNAVVVRVDSMSGPDEVPTEYNDWMNYGGLTREVLLIEVPRTFVRNYKLQLAKGSRDTVNGWVQVDGGGAGQTVTVSIPAAGIEHEATTDKNGLARISFPAELALWSPDDPRLYQVVISAGEDRVEEQIGFRSIETRGQDILLNGEPVFLRGVSLHEESLLRPGRAYGPEDARAVIARLRQMNANYVRLAHYPHNEHMVRAVDAAGIMVWAEMPIYHNINFAGPCTLQVARRQYREFIARDHNRAAVIMWSLANETPNTDDRNAFLRDLADFVRQQDDTRLLTAALLGFGGVEDVGRFIGMKLAGEENRLVGMLTDPDPVTIIIDDPLGDILDVLGYNEYFGWYMSGHIALAMRREGLEVSEAQVREVMLTEMPGFTIDTAFDKPLVISEFGAGARQGRRGGPLEIWSEDYQARVYRQQLQMLANSKSLRGLSPWILKDFRAPYRLNTRMQDYWNRKGLLSETGVEKLAFGIMRDHYARLSGGE